MVFWHLILAHFLGDYTFQTNWIARNKQRLPVLALHILIHLVTMIVLVGGALAQLWPFVLGIGAIHFLLDYMKIHRVYQRWKPNAVIFPYLFDQALHLLTIAAAAFWIARSSTRVTLPYGNLFVAYALSLVLVTSFWYITELVTTARNPSYQAQVIQQRLPRMVSRLLILVVFLILAEIALPTRSVTFFTLPALGTAAWLPYREANTRERAIITDCVVALGAASIARLAMGLGL